MPGGIGERVVAALGEPAARELLEVLERSDADRAALIVGKGERRVLPRYIRELSLTSGLSPRA